MLEGVKAIGLDLGQTLMRYEGVPMSWQALYPEALRAACYAAGIPADAGFLQTTCERLAMFNTRIHPRVIEVDAQQIFSEVLGELGHTELDNAIDGFFSTVRQSYAIYEDAIPFLTRMKNAGIPCGVLTDVPYGMPARWVGLDLEPFMPFLEVTISSVDVGFRKPHQAGFLALAGRMGIEPTCMAYVGDERKDIEGAKAAGMVAVLIDREGNLPDFGEDHRIADLHELLV